MSVHPANPRVTQPAPPTGPHRLLAGWHSTGRPADHSEHLRRYGALPLAAWSSRHGRARLIDEVDAAGLRGRGGAGFPTGRKLRAVAEGRRVPIVLANGCEGEPASGKDRVLLDLAPHLVLDGAVLAAHAVNASEVIVCVHDGDHAGERVVQAIAERDDPIRIRAVAVPGRYVASEESALVRYLNTGDARPTTKPPRPAERGVAGRRTLVDNVETLAHLALVARFGADWFRSLGTTQTPGTLLVTVGGAVRVSGVHEIPAGSPLGAALTLAGAPTRNIPAVLVGGYGGNWLPVPAALGVPLSHEGLRAAGAVLGVPVLLALPAGACGLAQTAHLVRYLAGESAGQCGPCRFGLPALAADLEALVSNRASAAVLDQLKRRLAVIAGRGACAHPDGAVRLAASALRVFRGDLADHLVGRPCRAARQPPLFPIPTRPHHDH